MRGQRSAHAVQEGGPNLCVCVAERERGGGEGREGEEGGGE